DGDLDNDGTPDITITGDANGDDVTRPDGTTDVLASQAAGTHDDNIRLFNATAETTINGLTLTGGSFVSSDFRADGGGAISVDPGFYGQGNPALTMTDSVVSGNYSGGINTLGGGIFVPINDAVITGSTISDNLAAGTGGGIFAGGLTLTGSTVSGNIALDQGLDGGGGIRASSVDIVNSTISNNWSDGRGGGIDASYVSATNATISGNTSGGGGGGIIGGGITLTNTTVTGNGTTNFRGEGGGVYAFSYMQLNNTLVLGNVSGYSYGADVAGDEIATDGAPITAVTSIVGANAAAFDASGFANIRNALPSNVFAQTTETRVDADGDGIAEAATGVIGGRVASNGGPVQTAALADGAGNPALDAGSDQIFDQVPAVDARGQSRFVDRAGIGDDGPIGSGIIDIGAFEFTGEVIEPCPGTPITVETAEIVAFVYEALLNRNGGIDNPGFNFWIDALEGALPNGQDPITLQQMVEAFYVSPEFIAAFGEIESFTPREIVELYYRNILDREGDTGGIDFWTGVIESGSFTPADVLIAFATAQENRDALQITVTDNGDCTWDVDVLLV
ncbi:MAG: DUF4214 domain-containing protein, partial [Pseudomonadota bacterium]